ncbi:hypothetical protein ES706_04134 [subsurface metagenome]|nr:hypothetical protein [Bacillota bacterium]
MRRTKFYKRISVSLISVLFTVSFLSIFYTQKISAEKGFQDIGLRVYNGAEIVAIAAEPAGTLTSPLRIAKNGAIYGIVLVEPGDANDSGVRIQTSSGIKGLRKYVFLPTAYVSINMWAKGVFQTWYNVYATVTVTENTASGPPIVGVTVQGTWSGNLNGPVSNTGTTNGNGQVTLVAEWIGRNGWVTFTVNKITTGSNEYDLTGTLSKSFSPG